MVCGYQACVECSHLRSIGRSLRHLFCFLPGAHCLSLEMGQHRRMAHVTKALTAKGSDVDKVPSSSASWLNGRREPLSLCVFVHALAHCVQACIVGDHLAAVPSVR